MAVPDLQDAINYLQQKDLDAAIRTLEQKIEELPAHLTAHVLLARAYEAKRQWTQSLKCWENVRFLMPNSPVGREGKQRVLRELEKPDESAPDETESAADDTSAETPVEKPSVEEDDENSDEDSPTTATEAVSELEQLRRQAEEEARGGGARPGLADTPKPASESPSKPSPSGDGSSVPPEERIDQMEREGDDLDRLINELESARIEPRPDVDDVPAPDLENDVDDIVSETLARIHEAQDKFRKAAQIYVKLASQEPDRAREYLQKAAEMREKAERKTEQDPPD